jgi:hypothetical protein
MPAPLSGYILGQDFPENLILRYASTGLFYRRLVADFATLAGAQRAEFRESQAELRPPHAEVGLSVGDQNDHARGLIRDDRHEV